MKIFSKALLFVLTLFLSIHIYSQDVPFVPTPYVVVEGMLDLAKVKNDDVVYDLGCGDGRIVVTAAKNYGARGVGVDSNPARIKESNENAKENNVTDKVEFHVQDLFDTDLRDATVVAIYLLSEVNIKLRPKLFKELKPGSRVVSNSFDMNEWEPEEKKIVGERNIYLWVMPENFSGNWEGKLTDNSTGENFELQLNQQFQKIQGIVLIENELYNLNDIKHDGKNLLFKAVRKNNEENISFRFEGTLEKDELNGSLIFFNGERVNKREFSLTRDPNTITPLDPALLKDIHVKGEK